MTGQKERACPCGHTDKLKENMNNLEYLRGGRHYLYNSIYQITRLEAYP